MYASTIMSFLSVIVLLISTAVVLEAAVARVPEGCEWDGQMYREGVQFNPDPCTSCSCDQGQAMCMSASCAPPSCVDSVHDRNQCCPVCPNGDNCRAPDGSIIPAGQEVLVGSIHCRCVTTGFMMFNEAVCSVN